MIPVSRFGWPLDGWKNKMLGDNIIDLEKARQEVSSLRTSEFSPVARRSSEYQQQSGCPDHPKLVQMIVRYLQKKFTSYRIFKDSKSHST